MAMCVLTSHKDDSETFVKERIPDRHENEW